MRAWYDVEKFLRDNRDEAVSIMAKVVKQDPKDYRIFLAGAGFFNEKDNLDSFAAASNSRSLAAVSVPLIKFLKEKKLIDGDINIAGSVDGSLVQEIAKR